MSPFNSCFAELPVNSARIVYELEQFISFSLCCLQRIAGATVVLVRKILSKGCSSPTDAEAPALECGGFVGKTGKVFSGFQHNRSQTADN